MSVRTVPSGDHDARRLAPLASAAARSRSGPGSQDTWSRKHGEQQSAQAVCRTVEATARRRAPAAGGVVEPRQAAGPPSVKTHHGRPRQASTPAVGHALRSGRCSSRRELRHGRRTADGAVSAVALAGVEGWTAAAALQGGADNAGSGAVTGRGPCSASRARRCQAAPSLYAYSRCRGTVTLRSIILGNRCADAAVFGVGDPATSRSAAPGCPDPRRGRLNAHRAPAGGHPVRLPVAYNCRRRQGWASPSPWAWPEGRVMRPYRVATGFGSIP